MLAHFLGLILLLLCQRMTELDTYRFAPRTAVLDVALRMPYSIEREALYEAAATMQNQAQAIQELKSQVQAQKQTMADYAALIMRELPRDKWPQELVEIADRLGVTR